MSATAALVTACTSSESAAPPATTVTCAIDETKKDDGSCASPGVPPSSCGAGFASDHAGGCNVILPSETCGAGTMAVPGDATCRPVGAVEPPECGGGQLALPGESACHDLADCGSGVWGAIPIEPSTQYVDLSYVANDSDGSAAKPWKTVGAGVAAATGGAIVAVAAGSYRENVVIQGKAVRLWGRCPKMVEIVASGGGIDAALSLNGAAVASSEAHTIALTGDGQGVSLASAKGVVFDRVWIHDTTQQGISAGGDFAMRGSLVENTTLEGIDLESSNAVVESTLVRGVQPTKSGTFGIGVFVLTGATLAMRGSVIEKSHDSGLLVAGGQATVEGSVLRDGLANAVDGAGGRGASAVMFRGVRGALTLRDSSALRNRDSGVLATASDVLLERVRVADGRSNDAKSNGLGLTLQADRTNGQPAKATVRGSLFEKNRVAAISAAGSDVVVEGSVLRDTASQESDGRAGFALHAERFAPVGANAPPARRASATVRGSILERNRTASLDVVASDATMAATLVRLTAVEDKRQQGGYGAQIQSDKGEKATLTMSGCVVTDNVTGGVLGSNADLVIDTSVVRATTPAKDGSYGRGITVQSPPGGPRASLALTSSLVADNVEDGVGLIQADATITGSWIRGTTKNVTLGAFGDGVSVAGGSAALASSRVEKNERAGVFVYGGSLTFATTTISCNAFDLDGEPGDSGDPSAIDLSGGARCGCNASSPRCQVLSSRLPPPTAIMPTK